MSEIFKYFPTRPDDERCRDAMRETNAIWHVGGYVREEQADPESPEYVHEDVPPPDTPEVHFAQPEVDVCKSNEYQEKELEHEEGLSLHRRILTQNPPVWGIFGKR